MRNNDIFNNNFIIYLLTAYKNNYPLSNLHLETLIKIEQNKITILYEEALNHIFSINNAFQFESFYDNIKSICQLDKREDKEKLYCMYFILRKKFHLMENSQRSEKLDFIISRFKKMFDKYHENIENEYFDVVIKIIVTLNNYIYKLKSYNLYKSFDYQILNMFKKLLLNWKMEETIIKFINNNDIINLKNYINKNNISFCSIKDEYNSKGINVNESLLTAYNKNNKEILEYLVNKGADINIPEEQKISLLNKAVEKENLDIIKNLIDWGININGKTDIVSPLQVAIQINNMNIIKYLVNHGANVNNFIRNEAPLHYAFLHNEIENDKKNDVKYFSLPLYIAVTKCNKNVVDYLIKNGAKVTMDDKDDYSHLNGAIMNQRIDIVNYLIKWAIKHDYENFNFTGNAYIINKKYNWNSHNKKSYLKIKNLLDSYVNHFNFYVNKN